MQQRQSAFDHQLWIDRRPAHLAVKRLQRLAEIIEVEGAVDAPTLLGVYGAIESGKPYPLPTVAKNGERPRRRDVDRWQPQHLKALKWRTPYQAICNEWTNDPAAFKINPRHLIPGPHT